MKKITIFFGEMGCGKTYCGSSYAERHGFEFFEGDSVVPPRMLEKVLQFKPLTQDIVEEYMDILSNAIADRAEKMVTSPTLIVSQAMYRNEDRESMKNFLESLGYEVRFWWVKVPLWRNVKNLLTRKDGWKWVYYWLINKPFFQSPKHEHDIYYNTYRD